MSKTKNRAAALGNLADELKTSISSSNETSDNKEEKTLKRENVKTDSNKNVKKKPTNMPWYPPSNAMRKELKQLALDEDTTIQALFTEAIEMLFEKRGKRFNDFT